MLTQSGDVADYFEATAAAAGNAKAASNWIMGELMRKANEDGVSLTSLPMTPAALGGPDPPGRRRHDHRPVAKEVFEKMLATGRPADVIVAAEGLARIDDDAAIEAAVRQVIDAERRRRRTVSGRQAADVRLPRRPGDEGHERARPARRASTRLMRSLLDRHTVSSRDPRTEGHS